MADEKLRRFAVLIDGCDVRGWCADGEWRGLREDRESRERDDGGEEGMEFHGVK